MDSYSQKLNSNTFCPQLRPVCSSRQMRQVCSGLQIRQIFSGLMMRQVCRRNEIRMWEIPQRETHQQQIANKADGECSQQKDSNSTFLWLLYKDNLWYHRSTRMQSTYKMLFRYSHRVEAAFGPLIVRMLLWISSEQWHLVNCVFRYEENIGVHTFGRLGH